MLTTKALALAGFRVLDDAEYYAKVRCAVVIGVSARQKLTGRNLDRQRRRSMRSGCTRSEGWVGVIVPRARVLRWYAMIFRQIGYPQVTREC